MIYCRFCYSTYQYLITNKIPQVSSMEKRGLGKSKIGVQCWLHSTLSQVQGKNEYLVSKGVDFCQKAGLNRWWSERVWISMVLLLQFMHDLLFPPFFLSLSLCSLHQPLAYQKTLNLLTPSSAHHAPNSSNSYNLRKHINPHPTHPTQKRMQAQKPKKNTHSSTPYPSSPSLPAPNASCNTPPPASYARDPLRRICRDLSRGSFARSR